MTRLNPAPATHSIPVAATRLAAHAAAVTLAGILLSGPVAVLMIARLHPQPAWQGAETFVIHYHPLQLLPYLSTCALLSLRKRLDQAPLASAGAQ